MGSSLKVALVHDWLTGMRGGEKVLEQFAIMFPDAPIYTLIHKPGSLSPILESRTIHTSILQRIPGIHARYRQFLPVMPRVIEQLKIDPVDVVLSTSSCVAKSVIVPPGAIHASYILSPMRYIYDRYDDYFSPDKAGRATRWAMRAVRGRLQRWDTKTADRADHICAISQFIADRIRRYYHRDSVIIHPPVNTDRFAGARREPEDYYLMVTALVPYKNVELAIDAFRGLDRRLVIAGSGPMEAKLRARANGNVTFLGWVPDDEIPRLVSGCRAFLMPNVEDFGIAPVEAMAAGRPVIAFADGGVLDTVRDIDRFDRKQLPQPSAGQDGPTGIFFDEMNPSSLRNAILRFEESQHRFQPGVIQSWSETFAEEPFRRKISDWIDRISQPARQSRAA